MANALANSDSAPFTSVMICYTTVNALRVLSKGKMFTFRVQTDWPLSCCWSFFEVSGSIIPAPASWYRRGRFFCSELLQSAATEDIDGVVNFENVLSVVVLGVLWYSLFRISSFICLQPWQLEGCAVYFGQLAVAPCRCWRRVPFLWTVLVQVVAPTPHAMGRCLAIRPYVAEPLAVVTLNKNILSYCKAQLWFPCGKGLVKLTFLRI
jgi:hypothetical protein